MDRDSPSHKNSGAKSGRGLRLIDYHLSLLRGKSLFKNSRSSWSPLKQMTSFIPSRTVFSVVILIIDETRVLWFAFRTIIDKRLRRSCFGGSALLLPFPFFLPFKALSAMVDLTRLTLQVLPVLDVAREAFSLGAGDFCFAGFMEDFHED